jgi:hypothetical protein
MVVPGKAPLDHQLTTPARANIWRLGLRIGADAGDKHEAGDASGCGLARHCLGALHVYSLKGQAALLDIG